MIRSKGVGVYFVTQHPTDVPSSVLGQLGNRIQHALRAFTPEDADALRKTVRTYPKSELYDLEQLLTSLGIGEAAVTVLNEQGVPTPVVHTRLRAPRASMEPAPDVDQRAKASPLWTKYGTRTRARERGRGAREACRGRTAGACRREEEREAEAGEARERPADRLPLVAPGQGAPARGGARRLRDVEEEALGRENALDRPRERAATREVVFQHGATVLPDRVDPPPPRLPRRPLAREHPAALETVQRGIDRPLGEVERAAAPLAQALDERVPVSRAAAKLGEQQAGRDSP
jgi:hypothetical protein